MLLAESNTVVEAMQSDSSPKKERQQLIRWQAPMSRVLYALVPAFLASVYFFGWRSLLVMLVVNAAGFLSEYLFCRHYREPVTSAVFVTSALFALSLPPTLPLWMAVVGIVFGVVFGKMVFGGFGKNIFNPALVGRAFIYVNFSVNMNNKWLEPFRGLPGGFARFAADTVTGATPLRETADVAMAPLSGLFLGDVAGCYGETSALLLILGGLYLLWGKTANYRIVTGCLVSAAVLQWALWAGGAAASDPARALLAGGFMLGAFYMATDPVSAPQTQEARWGYGVLIGLLTVVIREFSVWAEGFMFAVLLANMFVPLMDFAVRGYKDRKKSAVNRGP